MKNANAEISDAVLYLLQVAPRIDGFCPFEGVSYPEQKPRCGRVVIGLVRSGRAPYNCISKCR